MYPCRSLGGVSSHFGRRHEISLDLGRRGVVRLEVRVDDVGPRLGLLEVLGQGLGLRTERKQIRNNCSAEMWSGSDEGSYLRFIDFCITQL